MSDLPNRALEVSSRITIIGRTVVGDLAWPRSKSIEIVGDKRVNQLLQLTQSLESDMITQSGLVSPPSHASSSAALPLAIRNPRRTWRSGPYDTGLSASGAEIISVRHTDGVRRAHQRRRQCRCARFVEPTAAAAAPSGGGRYDGRDAKLRRGPPSTRLLPGRARQGGSARSGGGIPPFGWAVSRLRPRGIQPDWMEFTPPPSDPQTQSRSRQTGQYAVVANEAEGSLLATMADRAR